MLSLIKQLKPFGWQIAIIFMLLFGQAMTDLTLPDLMSRIVNIGIQQNGIENPAPDAIRVTEMSKLKILMSEQEVALVERDYRLLSKQTLTESEYQLKLEIYPQLASEPIYELIDSARSDVAQLNTIFDKPEFAVYFVETNGLSTISGGSYSSTS